MSPELLLIYKFLKGLLNSIIFDKKAYLLVVSILIINCLLADINRDDI